MQNPRGASHPREPISNFRLPAPTFYWLGLQARSQRLAEVGRRSPKAHALAPAAPQRPAARRRMSSSVGHVVGHLSASMSHAC